ncbi:MAG: glycyl-radical enzyme activating protein [bacterium]
MKGMIFNIMRYSVSDGPGVRTTVFLKGCPLKCQWCHNPESISPKMEIMLRPDRCIRCGDCVERCDHEAIVELEHGFITDRNKCIQCGKCVDACAADARVVVGREISTEELFQEIVKDRVFFDRSGGGVTFSGGEPLLQYEFLLSILELCKRHDLHTAIDTTGLTSPEILDSVSRYTDLFLYDFKIQDEAKHKEFTGVSNTLIKENLERLIEWQKEVIIRIPLIPGINDNAQHLHDAGRYLASLKNIKEIQVLPFHHAGVEKYQRLGMNYVVGDLLSPTKLSVEGVASLLQAYVEKVSIGG